MHRVASACVAASRSAAGSRARRDLGSAAAVRRACTAPGPSKGNSRTFVLSSPTLALGLPGFAKGRRPDRSGTTELRIPSKAVGHDKKRHLSRRI